MHWQVFVMSLFDSIVIRVAYRVNFGTDILHNYKYFETKVNIFGENHHVVYYIYCNQVANMINRTFCPRKMNFRVEKNRIKDCSQKVGDHFNGNSFFLKFTQYPRRMTMESNQEVT